MLPVHALTTRVLSGRVSSLPVQAVAVRRLSDYLTQYHDILHQARITWHQPTRPNDPRVPFDPLADPSQQPTVEEQPSRMEHISKAMRHYLTKAKERESFIEEKRHEFELGRRHLANIMGVEESLMMQNDINLAIEYLLPSGLFSKRALPKMRPPEEIYPPTSEAAFDVAGRPHHAFFFTTRPSFYQLCYDIEEETIRLNQQEDQLLSRGVVPNEKIDLISSRWMDLAEFRLVLAERIDEPRYNHVIGALERLAAHRLSSRAAELINKYRKEQIQVTAQMEKPPLLVDEATGRRYATGQGFRKKCRAMVVVWADGTGKMDFNGRDINYFELLQDRQQVMAPLKFCDMLFKVDVFARTYYKEEDYLYHSPSYHGTTVKTWKWDPTIFFPVDGPVDGRIRYNANQHKPSWMRMLGSSAEAGAIRLGMAMALRAMVGSETVERMRLAGLLTADVRTKERKKWGQEGARRKYTWKKR